MADVLIQVLNWLALGTFVIAIVATVWAYSRHGAAASLGDGEEWKDQR